MRVKVLNNRLVVYASVSEVLKEIFGEPKYRRYTYESGTIIHMRLGFNNDIVYRRWYETLDGKVAILLSGIPDRVEPPYVDELKTTVHGKEHLVRDRGYYQLQLYMFLTGLRYGRLYIYYKDSHELVLYNMWTANSNVIRKLLESYAELILEKMHAKKKVKAKNY